MFILFLHQNFPGQFKHIAADLVKEGTHQVLAIASMSAPGLSGVDVIRYKLTRSNTQGIHQYLISTESQVIRAQTVAKILLELKRINRKPDIIFAHVGWGEGLFVKDIYPDVPLITYFEFFYQAKGADIGYDPEIPFTLDDVLKLRVKNFSNLCMLNATDVGISPTKWQKSLYPENDQHKIKLIHEGIDCERAKPNASAFFRVNDNLTLTAEDEVITYVGRSLEPYRGFHRLMEVVEILNKERPQTHILIVGSNGVSYGRKPNHNMSYQEYWLKKLSLNLDRVHFLGRLQYEEYLKVLQISSAHLYLSIPFVLSWSLLEAMSSGCLVLASNTEPVREVIQDGENGFIVDYFSAQAIANITIEVLENRKQLGTVRFNARKTILENYTIDHGNKQYRDLISEYLKRFSV